jgi:hypothetical protein
VVPEAPLVAQQVIAWKADPDLRLLPYNEDVVNQATNKDPATPLVFHLKGTIEKCYLKSQGKYGHAVIVKFDNDPRNLLNDICNTSEHYGQGRSFKWPVDNKGVTTIKCLNCFDTGGKDDDELCTETEDGPFRFIWDASALEPTYATIHSLPLPDTSERRLINVHKVTPGSRVIVEYTPATYYISSNKESGCKLGLVSIGLVQSPKVSFSPRKRKASYLKE